jgi:3-oxoacyl-[acyl-carrier protein] reductase
MDLELKGKTALVTGSSAGIGAGTAQMLAGEGVRVAIHGRDEARLAEVLASLPGEGHIAARGDVTTEAGAKALADEVLAKFGRVDILANVVGGAGGPLTWDNTSDEMWLEQFQLNTMSAVRMMRHLVPGMKDNGWGRVINIASIAGVRPLPDLTPAYAASKASLIMTSLSMAMTVAGTGVTVNCLTPGFVATDALADFVLSSPGNEGKTWDEVEAATAIGWRIAVGRFGRPKDIAGLVTYLASPMADWITGSNFRIDGGTADWVG